jgi:hypothetical protein
MKLSLLYMDTGNELFSGYGTLEPLLVWGATSGQWEAVAENLRQEGWAQRVSPSEAQRCYPGSIDAPLPPGNVEQKEFDFEESVRLRPEMFYSYDGPHMRRSPEEKSQWLKSEPKKDTRA